MNPLRFKTIRSRLLAILSIALVVVVAVVGLGWYGIIEPALRMGVVQNQREIARRIADQIGEFLEKRIAEVDLVTEVVGFWDLDEQTQKAALYRLMKLDPQIREVAVVDHSGREKLRLSRVRVYTNADLTSIEKEEKFRRAIEGRVYLSPVYHAPTAEPFVTLAVPIRFTADDIRGVVVVEINLKTLWNAFSYIRVGRNGYAFVVDRRGTLIAHPDYSMVLLGMNVAHLHEVNEFLNNPQRDFTDNEIGPGLSGERALSTYAVVRNAGWGVLVEEAEESALAELRQVKNFGLLFLVFLSAGVFAVSYTFSKRIARPVSELEEGVRRIATGDLDHRLAIRTGDEIESLAGQLNHMAEQLRIYRDELESKVAEKTRELSTLYALTGPLSRADEFTGLLSDAVRKITEITGADAASIRLADESGRRFVFSAHHGFSEAYLRGRSAIVRDGRTSGIILESGQPIIAADLVNYEQVQNTYVARHGFRSAAYLPLKRSERVLGILTLASREPGRLNPGQEELLSAIAHQISISIENARLFERVKQDADELAVLHTAASTFNQSLDLRATLRAVLDAVMKVIAADAASIRLLDFKEDEMTFVVNHGFPDAYLTQRSRVSDIGAAARQVLATGEAILADDLDTDSVFRGGLLHSFGFRSVVYLPLKSKNRIFGLLNFVSKKPHRFDAREKNLLVSISHQLGTTLENAWLFGETQRNLERMRALREIDLAITSSLDLRPLLEILMEKIDLSLPYSAATIRLFNKETGWLEPVACRNLDEAEWKIDKWKKGRGLVNAVVEGKAPVFVRDAQADPRVKDIEFYLKHKLRSYLGVPLIVKDQVFGVLSFYTREEHEFTSEEVEFLTALAGQAAIAISNSQLYEEIKQQAVELERSNKVKSEFLSVMSHELRTPLNMIIGYAGMMQEGLLGELTRDQAAGLEKVVKCSDDLLAMITGILEATRIEAEESDLEIKEVSLTDFLEDFRLAYGGPVGERIPLRWRYDPDLPVVSIDPGKLKHVLVNLIGNALKFTERGEVVVSARHVTEDKSIEFQVKDSGIGIPREFLPLIFDMFRQVDSSETRSHGGVGLGLYIVKKFTELLSGNIRVESEYGKGSAFIVTVPCSHCGSEALGAR